MKYATVACPSCGHRSMLVSRDTELPSSLQIDNGFKFAVIPVVDLVGEDSPDDPVSVRCKRCDFVCNIRRAVTLGDEE